MNRQLFRQEALARRGRAEPLDGLLRVTAPHMWVALAGLAVVLAGALAWALLDRVDETVDADCALVLPGDRHAVLAQATGVVEETLVDIGDTVRAGQPLARLRTPSLDRQLIRSPVTGEIAALDLVPGQAAETGSQVALVRRSDGTQFEAVAFVSLDAAQQVRTGHLATVVRSTSGGDALSAEVGDVSKRPVAAGGWLAGLGLSPSPRSHLVTLSLAAQPSIKLADGESCRVRIVVGTRAPIALLGAAQPAGHGAR